MLEEGSTRRELLRRMLTLGPLAGLAGAFAANGGNGVRRAEATDIPDNLTVTGTLTVTPRVTWWPWRGCI